MRQNKTVWLMLGRLNMSKSILSEAHATSLYRTHSTLWPLCSLMLQYQCMHSASLSRPAPLPLTVANHKEAVRPEEKNMSRVTHIRFGMEITGAEPWHGSRSRSDPGIISKSFLVHVRSQTSPEFNNVTLHTAAVNSSKFQGWKSFHFK